MDKTDPLFWTFRAVKVILLKLEWEAISCRGLVYRIDDSVITEPLLDRADFIQEWQVTDRIWTALLTSLESFVEGPGRCLEHRVEVEVSTGFKTVLSCQLIPSCRYTVRTLMERNIQNATQREWFSVTTERTIDRNVARDEAGDSFVIPKQSSDVVVGAFVDTLDITTVDAQSLRNTQLDKPARLKERITVSMARFRNRVNTLTYLCRHCTYRSELFWLEHLVQATKLFKGPEGQFLQPIKELGETAVCYSNPSGSGEWASSLLRPDPTPKSRPNSFNDLNSAEESTGTKPRRHIGYHTSRYAV
jgi:hypothetical protein